jgi:hypothetical protein
MVVKVCCGGELPREKRKEGEKMKKFLLIFLWNFLWEND